MGTQDIQDCRGIRDIVVSLGTQARVGTAAIQVLVDIADTQVSQVIQASLDIVDTQE